MDNQQERPGLDRAWLGGIVDGEGCISATKCSRKTVGYNVTIVPCTTITNTDEEILNECKRILDEKGMEYNFVNRKKRAEHHKESFAINIFGLTRNMKFLPWILPELRSKKRVLAEKILEFSLLRHENTVGKFKGVKYNDQEMALINEILRLQQPGILNDYTSNAKWRR
jgi:hypothetical protein